MAQLDSQITRAYWDLVDETLQVLLGGHASSDVLRNEVSKLLPDEQEVFYHAEPLDIAGDLAGVANDELHRVAKAYDLLKSRHFGTWPLRP